MTAGTPGAGRQKMLLVATSVAFALWIAAMLAMYFTTVYPQRYPAAKPQSTQSP
jgi:hypothetical protein